jgi:hypothetical protein
MPRRIHLAPYLTDDKLHDPYRRAGDPVERSHWHFLWLLAGGMTASAVAAVTSYCSVLDWIESPGATTPTAQTACATGAMRCAQGSRTCRSPNCRSWKRPWPVPILTATVGAGGPSPSGWPSGSAVRSAVNWAGATCACRARWLKPRRRHAQADAQAQADFKQHLRPSPRTRSRRPPRTRPSSYGRSTNTALVNRHFASTLGVGGRPGAALCRTPRPAGPCALNDPLPLVATADPSPARTTHSLSALRAFYARLPPP